VPIDVSPLHAIDTHLHFWDLDRAEYSWLQPEYGILYRSYRPPDFEPERESTPIAGAVLVQAANNPEDTTIMMEYAAAYDWIVGVVGWVPLLQPEQVGDALEQLAQSGYLSGIRHLNHIEPDPDWLVRAPVLDSLRILAERDVPFDVVVRRPEHLQAALHISEEIPKLRLVLDHLGLSDMSDEALAHWRDSIAVLEANKNVYVKVSGLGTIPGVPATWGREEFAPHVEYLLQQLGPKRCMVGGDWPVCKLGGGYQHAWQVYAELFAELDESDQRRVWRRTAERCYDLDEC
jgi:L-fuconolactonase